MATRLKPGMIVPVDWVTSPSIHEKPVTLIRFHPGGYCKELSKPEQGWEGYRERGPGWLCQFEDGRYTVLSRAFLAVNRSDEKGSGPPDPHRHDWYYNQYPEKKDAS